MALLSIWDTDEPAGLTPEQERHYEAVYLTRRGKDTRGPRSWWWRAPGTRRAERIEAEPSAPAEPETKAQPRQRPSKRKRRLTVERSLSLQEMARQMTGKTRRA
jgi:hypothetical protein